MSLKNKTFRFLKSTGPNCPLCGTKTVGCHVGDYCPKEGCPYVDGGAWLTEKQVLKHRDKLCFP